MDRAKYKGIQYLPSSAGFFIPGIIIWPPNGPLLPPPPIVEEVASVAAFISDATEASLDRVTLVLQGGLVKGRSTLKPLFGVSTKLRNNKYVKELHGNSLFAY